MAVIFLLAIGCGHRSEKEKLDTEIVNNSNTASGESDLSATSRFEFEKETHDFGRVIQGEKVSYAFRFKNSGKSALLISKANASCGCTVADYPKHPIRPGGEGEIKISFNTESRKGIQTKSITLLANTQPNTKILSIRAEVYLPEKE